MSRHELFRIAPALPVQDYRTFALRAPRSTHFRPATCAEVACRAHEHGWVTVLPTDGEQALYVRSASGRSFREELRGPGLTAFVFPPGQTCFAASSHRVPLEREPVYLVRDGDWRGNPTGRRRVHTRAQDWIEDFGENQLALVDLLEKG